MAKSFSTKVRRKLEETHREFGFVVRSQGNTRLAQKRREIRRQRDRLGRLAPAGYASFDENLSSDLANSAESLWVREAIRASEAPDRPALFLEKRQGGVLTHIVTEWLQLSVDDATTQFGLERPRVEDRGIRPAT